MPSQTRSTPRFQRPGSTQSARSSGRFGRSTSSGGRVGRPSAPAIRRRKPQPQSGPRKALKAIGALVPAAAAGKATKKTAKKAGKKPIGLALVAGAAGLAYSQREKLQAKLGGGKDDDAVTPVTPSADGVGTPVVPENTPPATGI